MLKWRKEINREIMMQIFFFRRSQKAFEIVLVQTFRNPHSICDTYIHIKPMFVLLFERVEELS